MLSVGGTALTAPATPAEALAEDPRVSDDEAKGALVVPMVLQPLAPEFGSRWRLKGLLAAGGGNFR